MPIIVKKIEFDEDKDNKQESRWSQNKSWQPQSENQQPQNAEPLQNVKQNIDSKNQWPQNVDDKGGQPQNAATVLWLGDKKQHLQNVDDKLGGRKPQDESQRPQRAEPQQDANKIQQPQDANKIQQPQDANPLQDARQSQSVRPPQDIENGNRPQSESRRLQDAEGGCQACKISSGTAQNNVAKRLSYGDGGLGEMRNELSEMQKAGRKGEYKAEEKRKEDQDVESQGDDGKRDVESRGNDVKKEEKGSVSRSKEGKGVDKRSVESQGDEAKKENRSEIARNEGSVDKDTKAENREEGVNRDVETRGHVGNERSGVENNREEVDKEGVEGRNNEVDDTRKEGGKGVADQGKEGERSRDDDKERDARNEDMEGGARGGRSGKVGSRKGEVDKRDVENRGDRKEDVKRGVDKKEDVKNEKSGNKDRKVESSREGIDKRDVESQGDDEKKEDRREVASQGKGDEKSRDDKENDVKKEDRKGNEIQNEKDDRKSESSEENKDNVNNRTDKNDRSRDRKNEKNDYDEDEDEEYDDEWRDEDNTVAYPGVYNTMQVVDVTKNVIASTSQLRMAFNQLIERFADVNTKSYDYNVPEKYIVKELMLRKYKGKSLNSVKGMPIKEVVVLMLDNSGSMVWWTEILTKMAEVALKRKDVEVYLVPNGYIQERLTDKGREPVNGVEVMKKLHNRTIIYIGDFDGANTPILLSKNNNVIWFCNEARYRNPWEHDWVTIDKDFQGMFFRTFTLEDLIAAMKEAVRKGYIPKYKKEKDLREAPVRVL